MTKNEGRGRASLAAEVERLWTVPEMAAATGLSQTRWRREIDAGRLRFTDAGSGSQRRSIRVADSEVRRWLESRTIETVR